MKMPSLGWAIAGVLAAGGVGYYLGAERTDFVSCLALERTAPLDYYASQQSFSEVENAKSSLEALCMRFRTAVRAERAVDHEAKVTSSGAGPASEPHLDGAIANLEEGMSEFAGTEQELEVAQDLLFALKKANRFDRWIDVYLRVLYKHPTNQMASRLAHEAIGIADQCGRQQSVLAGLLYLQSVPAEFQGCPKLEEARLQAGDRSQVASHDPPKPAVFP